MDIESLRVFCKTLPAATEDIKWGQDLCFCVGGKMFCVAGLEGPFQLSFKVREEEFEALCNSEAFVPAPYVARYKWVLMVKPGMLTDREIKDYVKQSYGLVSKALSAKIKKDTGLD